MADKIDSIYQFTDKGLHELESWLEPWFRDKRGGGGVLWEDVGLSCGSIGTSGGVFTDCESFVTLSVLNWTQGVLARVQPASPGVGGGAYSCLSMSAGTSIAIFRTITDTGAAGEILATTDLDSPLVDGDKIGLTCVANQIRGWVYHDGAWSNVHTVTDDTWESGYLGIYQIQQDGRLDDWGGGVADTDTVGIFGTPVLDNFNRPDEEPLAGFWTTRTATPLKVEDNQVTQGGLLGLDSFAAAYWTP